MNFLSLAVRTKRERDRDSGSATIGKGELLFGRKK